MSPPDLRYTEEHEWVRVESDGVAVIGITEFAAESLGDVVFLDLPPVDTELTGDEKMGEIESVKAVSDIYSPISGRVLERNEKAIENPEMVNESPYESGWLIKVAFSVPSALDGLMTARQYEAFLASQEQ
jgi:glycine cleavage system H protein